MQLTIHTGKIVCSRILSVLFELLLHDKEPGAL